MVGGQACKRVVSAGEWVKKCSVSVRLHWAGLPASGGRPSHAERPDDVRTSSWFRPRILVGRDGACILRVGSEAGEHGMAAVGGQWPLGSTCDRFPEGPSPRCRTGRVGTPRRREVLVAAEEGGLVGQERRWITPARRLNPGQDVEGEARLRVMENVPAARAAHHRSQTEPEEDGNARGPAFRSPRTSQNGAEHAKSAAGVGTARRVEGTPGQVRGARRLRNAESTALRSAD